MDHVGHTGSVAEVVVLRGELPIGKTANTDSTEVKVGSCWQRKASGRALKKWTPQHGGYRDHPIEQNLLLRVDILKKHLKGFDSLANAIRERFPFIWGEDLGKQIAKPSTLAPNAIPFDVKSDSHFAHGRLKLIIQGSHFSTGHFIESIKEGAVNFAGLSLGIEGFVMRKKIPLRAHRVYPIFANHSRVVSTSFAI